VFNPYLNAGVNWSGVINVVYTYGTDDGGGDDGTPGGGDGGNTVPEPGTLALTGAALILLVRRGRSAVSSS